MIQVGITERGDAALSNEWKSWVDKGLPTILITKNPIKLIDENPLLFSKSNRKGNVILHATITGMGGTPLEPNVRPAKYVIADLKARIDNPDFDKKRIVIRQDPIFVPFVIGEVGNNFHLLTFSIAKFAKDNGLRYRMSFLDLYPHVIERLNKMASEIDPNDERWKDFKALEEPIKATDRVKSLFKYQPEMHLPLETRLGFLELIKSHSGLTDEEIEICGEPGMKCSGCLSKKDFEIFGIELDKDPDIGFQRPTCACLGLKKELLSNKHPCGHKCVYCFWKD